ncbi:MAG: ATP-dependent DNA helicase RecG [Planctomycetes bacterium]|nr:ATP-dependent DNA helicase RecG [Planctomycetota bacterium]MBI3835897.1 ATP-dependent DNA helicase RecG [Planctomycetota bacterium]
MAANAVTHSTLTLDSSAQFVRGVGPARAALLAQLGVGTVRHLIEYFPFRHEHRPQSKAIGSLVLEEIATVVGEIRRLKVSGLPNRKIVQATVIDGTGQCTVRWFNAAYVADELRGGDIIRLSGKVDAFNDRACFTNPKWSKIDPSQADLLANDVDEFEPIYSATAELPSRAIAKMIRTALESVGDQLGEFLPQAIRTKHRFPARPEAILRFHHPSSKQEISASKRRLAYEEFFLLQLAVQFSRTRRASRDRALKIPISPEVDRRIRRRIPFALTKGQERAVSEIASDLARDVPMNRLLQADVGAGKTAVAVYAALAAIANKTQVALVAPTEILVRQHFEKVQHYLRGSRVRMACLLGATSKSERSATLRALQRGELDWVIGTHALFESDVSFQRLALVLIDEQHKFGVAQRAALRTRSSDKTLVPHTLVLTATPIPRTLAMTVFGDLDVSTIGGLPPGRQPITTRLVTSDLHAKAWEFVRSHLARGEQAYVVYPLVEESENLELKSATDEAKRLARDELAGFEVGLLHGRMKAAEKAAVMENFRHGKLRVLVATTVIEVGVDVPNATMMIVRHAERYGLSQLHQLRGRIGRGSKRSYCLLFAETREGAAAERLKVLCETSDGFRIAEEDMRLRGPGELLSTRQHGMPEFKVANLAEDFPLLEQARDDAARILHEDPNLRANASRELYKELVRKFGRRFSLVDVS